MAAQLGLIRRARKWLFGSAASGYGSITGHALSHCTIPFIVVYFSFYAFAGESKTRLST